MECERKENHVFEKRIDDVKAGHPAGERCASAVAKCGEKERAASAVGVQEQNQNQRSEVSNAEEDVGVAIEKLRASVEDVRPPPAVKGASNDASSEGGKGLQAARFQVTKMECAGAAATGAAATRQEIATSIRSNGRGEKEVAEQTRALARAEQVDLFKWEANNFKVMEAGTFEQAVYTVGDTVGACVGTVGEAVGETVGEAVGEKVGACVSPAFVGDAVGDTVECALSCESNLTRPPTRMLSK